MRAAVQMIWELWNTHLRIKHTLWEGMEMDRHSRCCTGWWLLEATIELCVDGAITGDSRSMAQPRAGRAQGAPDPAPPVPGNGGATRRGVGTHGGGAAASLLPPRAEVPGKAAGLGHGLPRSLAHGKAPSPSGRSGSRAVAARPGLAAAVPVSPVPMQELPPGAQALCSRLQHWVRRDTGHAFDYDSSVAALAVLCCAW